MSIDTQYKVQPIDQHVLFNDAIYGETMHKLKNKHAWFVSCDRDGNCFYRAAALLLIPYITQDKYKREFLGFSEQFKTTGTNEAIYEWYIESIEEVLQSLETKTPEEHSEIKDKRSVHESLNEQFSKLTEESLQLLIGYLRLVCSTEAQTNVEKYSSFVEGELKQYCSRCIEPMEQRAGDFEIALLANALQAEIQVTVVGEEGLREVRYGNEQAEIKIEILHTPDHFEPLYF